MSLDGRNLIQLRSKDGWDDDKNLTNEENLAIIKEEQRLLTEYRITNEVERKQEFMMESLPCNDFYYYHNLDTSDRWAGSWTFNRIIAVCHNCGYISHKYSASCKKRCGSCGTKDITLIRSGDISLLIRNAEDRIGIYLPTKIETEKRRRKEERKIRRENVKNLRRSSRSSN